MIKGAIFDLDGTLIDSMPVWLNVGKMFLNSIGIEPPAQFYEDVKFLEILDYAVYFNKHYGTDLDPYEVKKAVYGILEDYYTNKFQLKEGVREFLAMLKDKGVKLTVATATDEFLVRKVLERNGIYNMFEATFSCRDYNTSKYEPKIFDVAREKMGTPKEETFIFEDALYSIKTAAANGYPICGVYEKETPEHQAEIKELSTVYIKSFAEGMEIFSK